MRGMDSELEHIKEPGHSPILIMDIDGRGIKSDCGLSFTGDAYPGSRTSIKFLGLGRIDSTTGCSVSIYSQTESNKRTTPRFNT